MIKRIAQTAGFTGLLAALLLTLLQSFWVAPLILQAETFEKAPAATQVVHEHAAGTAAHAHDAEAWEPEDGWQRVLSTTGGNLVVAVGFALMLAGLYTLRTPTRTSQGLLWGLAGYATFVLAPTLGLPPELPGTAAADAAFAVAKPGLKFRDLHAAAMAVIAQKTAEWGFLPVSAEESLKPEVQFHRRWMVHGTSHHLGLDVHDCAQARKEMYLDAELKPGMIFTIEPGLYFQSNDLMVPEEFRGIGVRIEDDVLVTENGVENLSAALPRQPDEIESWMASLLRA